MHGKVSSSVSGLFRLHRNEKKNQKEIYTILNVISVSISSSEFDWKPELRLSSLFPTRPCANADMVESPDRPAPAGKNLPNGNDDVI